MEKGDIVLVLIIIALLMAIALITTNLDRLFPNPTVIDAINQSINGTI